MRREDKKGEKIIGDFLQRHYYQGLINLENPQKPSYIKRIDRITDKKQQTNGIDVQIHLGYKSNPVLSKEVNIDEKTALYYPKGNMNKLSGINTFAFELKSEISYKGRGTDIGWLFSNNCTNYYLLNWVTIFIGKPNNMFNKRHLNWWNNNSIENGKIKIQEIESYLISKKKLISFITKIMNSNPKTARLYSKPKELNDFMKKNHKNNYNDFVYSINEETRLMLNNNLPEKPVNIIINKSQLGQLAVLKTADCKI